MFLRLQESWREVERPKQAEKGLKSGMSEHKRKIKSKKRSYKEESAVACGRLLKQHETEKGGDEIQKYKMHRRQTFVCKTN
jgi:hypothetical protein